MRLARCLISIILLSTFVVDRTPAFAAGVIIAGVNRCTLVDGITAANTDTATGRC
jgi:hypothetical protein